MNFLRLGAPANCQTMFALLSAVLHLLLRLCKCNVLSRIEIILELFLLVSSLVRILESSETKRFVNLGRFFDACINQNCTLLLLISFNLSRCCQIKVRLATISSNSQRDFLIALEVLEA